MAAGRFDALFIDFYGTIVTGDRAAVEETCRRVVEDFDLAVTAPQLAIAWGRRFFEAIAACNHDGFMTLFECECLTLRATVRPLVGDIDPTPYARMLKAYWADPPLADHAAEALADIEIPICVVSNADSEDIHGAVERLGLALDEVVTSEEARSYKPDAAIFRTALARMNVDPSRVLHVGDSLYSDIGGAKKVGIHTCWVQYEDRIMDVGGSRPDHKVASLQELRRIL